MKNYKLYHSTELSSLNIQKCTEITVNLV